MPFLRKLLESHLGGFLLFEMVPDTFYLNDFDIAEGGTLLVKEWDPETKTYSGREISKTVGHVGKWKVDEITKFWPKEDILEKGIQIISLKLMVADPIYP